MSVSRVVEAHFGIRRFSIDKGGCGRWLEQYDSKPDGQRRGICLPSQKLTLSLGSELISQGGCMERLSLTNYLEDEVMR